MILTRKALREKCPYSEFFWSIFSCIGTEYGEIRSIKMNRYYSCHYIDRKEKLAHLIFQLSHKARKFFTRRKNNKADSIKTGSIVIVYFREVIKKSACTPRFLN